VDELAAIGGENDSGRAVGDVLSYACHQTRSFIRVLDEGGLIWKGHRRYPSLDPALADAEAGVARWMKDELGITDGA